MSKKLMIVLAVLIAFSGSPAHAATLDSHSDVIRARGTDTYTMTLEGGRSYLITVDGDGDTDLDAFLYDENDNLVAKDDDETDYCVLRVRPRWSGPFELKIKNLGRMANLYTLTLE